jgi:hypothetical protein
MCSDSCWQAPLLAASHPSTKCGDVIIAEVILTQFRCRNMDVVLLANSEISGFINSKQAAAELDITMAVNTKAGA